MTTNRTAIVRFLPVSRSSGIFIARHLAHQSSTVRGLTRSEPIGQAALPPREAAAGRTGVPHKSAIHRSDAENNRSTRGGGCCQASLLQLVRWLVWAAAGPFAVRIDCQMTTLNPTTEIISPARLIQSPTVICTGS
jgi:hypothetical protein